jgi:hypothetical protein
VTHCAEFFQKWKKEPNFCGVGRATAQKIDRYIDFVEGFSKEYKIPEEVIVYNAPMGAVSELLRYKEDVEIRKDAEKQIAKVLTEDKKAITSNYVKHIIGITPKTKPIFKSPVVAAASGISKAVMDTTRVQDRVRLINNASTSGQKNILLEIMSREGLDNEYDAYTKALIWAKERMDND